MKHSTILTIFGLLIIVSNLIVLYIYIFMARDIELLIPIGALTIFLGIGISILGIIFRDVEHLENKRRIE